MGGELPPPPPPHVSPQEMRLDPLRVVGSSVPIALPFWSRTFLDAAGTIGWSNRVSTGTIESDLSSPLVERHDRLRFIELGDDENVGRPRPRFAMLFHRHVEFERSNRGDRAEYFILTALGPRGHALEQASTVLRPQVGRELQLVLAKWSGAH